MLLGNRAIVLCASSLLGVHTTILDSGKSELQQFLLKYSVIPGSSCVCKACEHPTGLAWQIQGRIWNKQNIKKEKPCCCVPGCGKTSNVLVVVFADFDTICATAKFNVSVSECQTERNYKIERGKLTGKRTNRQTETVSTVLKRTNGAYHLPIIHFETERVNVFGNIFFTVYM